MNLLAIRYLLPLAALAPIGASADTFVNGVANANAGLAAPVQDSQFDSSAVSVSASNTYTNPVEHWTVSSNAQGAGTAAYGVLKAGVSGSILGAGSDSSVAASFSDTFTVSGGPGLEGTTGSLAVRVAFAWVGNITTSGLGSAVLDGLQRVRIDSGIGLLEVEERAVSHDARNAGADFSYRTVARDAHVDTLPFVFSYEESVPFQFGSPITLSSLLSVHGEAGAGNIGDTSMFSLDALHSFYWGGMTVYDSTGAPVDATVDSASGTDWSQSFIPSVAAVPEPETYAMLAMGLFLLQWQARRSSKARRPAG